MTRWLTRRTARRRSLLTLTAAVTLALGLACGLISPTPALADDPVNPLSFTVDKTQAHPGDSVTITLTFTNPEAVDVTFSYASVNPYWWSSNNLYGFSSCTGDVSWCWLYGPQHSGVEMTHDVTIAPQATRTATVTYDIAADSPCGDGRNIAFSLYTYRESSAGAADLMIWDGPRTDVIC